MTDDSITGHWLSQPGPIHLRHTERKDLRLHDAKGIEGMLLAVIITCAVIAWTVVAVRLFA